MHVAVCDDNIADRKQTERLLGRESDKRAKVSEGLYIDSYGNEKALLSNPMQYDIFYIDMCKTDGITGADVAKRLLSVGVQVPIYMCCSDIDYRTFNLPETVHFIDKPLKSDALTASLDYAYEVKQSAVPLIELREEKETLYVTEPDIMYGIAEDRHVTIHLVDGRIAKISSTIENLFDQWENFESFMVPTLKVIVNGRYIEKIGLFHITMTDGRKFSIHSSLKKYAATIQKKYTNHE